MARASNFMEIIPCVLSRVGGLENNLLIALVTNAEIEHAIYQIHPTKSSGLDGFNAGFFHHHWETMGGVVLGMVKNSFKLAEC
ncbi:hypothetical protein ACFX13_033317 [Malus domestica]